METQTSEISQSQVKKTNTRVHVENAEFCAEYHQAVELIGRRWMGAILFALMERPGPHRFSELQSVIPGISHRLLTERLKELEASRIISRTVITASPIRVEYELTAAGLDLQEAVQAIMNWGKKWLSSNEEIH